MLFQKTETQKRSKLSDILSCFLTLNLSTEEASAPLASPWLRPWSEGRIYETELTASPFHVAFYDFVRGRGVPHFILSGKNSLSQNTDWGYFGAKNLYWPKLNNVQQN